MPCGLCDRKLVPDKRVWTGSQRYASVEVAAGRAILDARLLYLLPSLLLLASTFGAVPYTQYFMKNSSRLECL